MESVSRIATIRDGSAQNAGSLLKHAWFGSNDSRGLRNLLQTLAGWLEAAAKKQARKMAAKVVFMVLVGFKGVELGEMN